MFASVFAIGKLREEVRCRVWLRIGHSQWYSHALCGYKMWMRTLRIIAVILAASLWVSPEASAQREQPSEHFPPNPQVDWRHVRLDLRIGDMNKAVLEGKATYTFAAAGQRVESIRLDAGSLEVIAVREGGTEGKPLEWSHEKGVLQIRLREPIGPSEPAEAAAPMSLVIEYRVTDPRHGMTFSSAIPSVDGQPAVAAEVHTQGEPQMNHNWFPVHDFPNIRLATEVVMDVPRGVSVSANGRLIEHKTAENREIWHWLQEIPHVPYLVSVVAGNFQRTELPAPVSGVPMAVWTRPAHAGMASATYANTDRMMGCFGRVFGRAYPWDRYDQLVVRNFGAGGMENTSATTMNSGALLDATALLEGDMDGLISHELCHQWTGDWMTCRSWEHIWLNEGWATYGTALWMEERDGVDGYYDSVLGSFGVAADDSGAGRGTPVVMPQAMCSRVYGSAGETFRRAANPYPKGASILHMLRRLLGDEVFFRGVRLYTARHGGKLVETDDFRACLEEVSGRSLEEFFAQWCFRPGCPLVKVAASYDAGLRILSLSVEQKSRGDAISPMKFGLPILVRTALGERTLLIGVTGAITERQFELDGPPTMIVVDPMLDVLKVLEVTHAPALLIEQMKNGPTSSSRRQAARALRATDSQEVRDALAVVVRDPTMRWQMRVEALEALAVFGSPEGRATTRALFDELVAPTCGISAADAAQVCHPQLRAKLADAVAVAPLTEALPRLESVLTGDAGYAPRIAAVAGIARLGSVDFPEQRATIVASALTLEGIAKMLAVSTPNERVRAAALEAIGALNLAQFQERVLALAALGHGDRLRPTAVATLVKLSASPADSAARAIIVTRLVELLDDSESRTRDAAGEALADLKATEGLTRLDTIAASHPDSEFRDRAAKWSKRIRPQEPPAPPPAPKV